LKNLDSALFVHALHLLLRALHLLLRLVVHVLGRLVHTSVDRLVHGLDHIILVRLRLVVVGVTHYGRLGRAGTGGIVRLLGCLRGADTGVCLLLGRLRGADTGGVGQLVRLVLSHVRGGIVTVVSHVKGLGLLVRDLLLCKVGLWGIRGASDADRTIVIRLLELLCFVDLISIILHLLLLILVVVTLLWLHLLVRLGLLNVGLSVGLNVVLGWRRKWKQGFGFIVWRQWLDPVVSRAHSFLLDGVFGHLARSLGSLLFDDSSHRSLLLDLVRGWGGLISSILILLHLLRHIGKHLKELRLLLHHGLHQIGQLVRKALVHGVGRVVWSHLTHRNRHDWLIYDRQVS